MAMVKSNKMDLLISFDTTGSMYQVLSQVRREVSGFINEMFSTFTDLRIGVIVHGDYCDEGHPYTILAMDFTRDENKLVNFVKTTESTYGGDFDECYELVLNTVHSDKLTWRNDANKIMVMIGDATPHPAYYSMNKQHLDWEEELKKVADRGVKIFAVHALSYYRGISKSFYQALAQETSGVYLTLDQFNEVVDLIKATIYQTEDQIDDFITIIRGSGKYTRSMDVNLRRLKGEKVEDDYSAYSRGRSSCRRTSYSSGSGETEIKEMEDLVPVLPGRFQTMVVDKNCDIRGFVEHNGITFKKGRGFYELSKAETVQQYKEVIMQDRETGEMFTGKQVRERLGLQPQSVSGGVKEKLHKADAEKFRVFVQSTSVNRKLIAGTTFLYEINDLEVTGHSDYVLKTKVSSSSAKDIKVDSKADSIEDKPKVKKNKASESKKTKEKKEEKKAIDVEVKKSTKIETTETLDDGVEWSDSISEVVYDATGYTVDHDAAKVKETKKKEDSVKKVENLFTSSKSRADVIRVKKNIQTASEKMDTAILRYEASANKKNSQFLYNQLKVICEMGSLAKDVMEKLQSYDDSIK